VGIYGRASAAGNLIVMQEKQDPVFQRMCELLAPFNIRQLELTSQTHITTDLEIDSVAVLDLIMEIEDEYGVSFPMNLISEIRTVGDLVNAIHQLMGAK
jgi:acyl carrier protein